MGGDRDGLKRPLSLHVIFKLLTLQLSRVSSALLLCFFEFSSCVDLIVHLGLVLHDLRIVTFLGDHGSLHRIG